MDDSRAGSRASSGRLRALLPARSLDTLLPPTLPDEQDVLQQQPTNLPYTQAGSRRKLGIFFGIPESAYSQGRPPIGPAHAEMPPSGLQPRGPVERQNNEALVEWLNATTAGPDLPVRSNTPDPTSTTSICDWDDSSDGSSLKAFKYANLRSIERATERAFSASPMVNPEPEDPSPIAGLGLQVDGWLASAQRHAQEKREATWNSVVNASRFSSPASQTVGSQTVGSPSSKRNSLFKLFGDPVWNANDVDLMQFMNRDKHPATSPKPRYTIPLLKAGGTVTGVKDVPEVTESTVPTLNQASASADSEGKWCRVNDDANTPVRQEKRKRALTVSTVPSSGQTDSSKVRADEPISPPIPSLKSASLASPSVNSSSVESPSVESLSLKSRLLNSPYLKNAKGYPSPEDPDWDDAVKRTKKVVRETEKREAEEARQQKKQMDAEEKREAQEARQKKKAKDAEEKKIRKLSAGKNAILRGSQLGLMTRKPLDSITEEEFETVGALAIAPEKEASKFRRIGTLGNLFTKMLGTSQEKQQQMENTKLQLEKHQSLELLNSPVANQLSKLADVDVTQYDTVLQTLTSDGECKAELSAHSSRTLVKKDVAAQEAQPKDSIGLGISEHSKSNSKRSTSYTESDLYSDGSNLYMDCQQLKSNEEPKESASLCNHHSLGNKAKDKSASTGVKRRFYPTMNESVLDLDDKSSWCTESVYSTDEPDTPAAGVNLTSPHQRSQAGVIPAIWSDVDARDNARFNNRQPQADLDEGEYKDRREIEDPDALPAPLRVLKVRTRKSHMQPTDPNSFIPDRQASFHAKIQEVSRLQEANIGSRSHPALRNASETSVAQTTSTSFEPSSSFLHLDCESFSSGLRSTSNKHSESADEGYTTGAALQREFDINRLKGAASKMQEPSGPEKDGAIKAPDNNVTADPEPALEVDVDTLRAEVGLDPLELANPNDTQKHPHHPFKWDHEKIMCRGGHHPTDPFTQDGHSSATLEFTTKGSNTPIKKILETAQACENCGSFCCRYANLINTSKIKTSGDPVEELVRSKAQQRVHQLRTQHPNGVEYYNTFLTCKKCGNHVCPGCAERCNDIFCQAIVCNDCVTGYKECPIHNLA